MIKYFSEDLSNLNLRRKVSRNTLIEAVLYAVQNEW